MKTTIAVLTITGCILLISPAYAQTNVTVPQAQPAAVSGNDAVVQTLKDQIQLQQQFTSDTLNTVYFTLGVTIAVLLTMIGVGWYQGHRVYERDKEELTKTAGEIAEKTVRETGKEIERRLTDRFDKFESSISQAVANVRMGLQADIFSAAHHEPTPRTDFMVLISNIRLSIGRAHPDVLRHALAIVAHHVETSSKMDGSTRTALLELVSALPPDLVAHAVTLQEAVGKKE